MEFEVGMSYGSMALRLTAALVLGGVLGFEREWSRRPAGLRTHVLVACAAALYTLLSDTAAQDAGDPGRVAANVATGIGFIGAGTIMRQGSVVRGLTTAASLWMAAAIGVACGLEWYPAAIMASGISLVVLVVFDIIEDRWMRRGEQFFVTFSEKSSEYVARLSDRVEDAGGNVKAINPGLGTDPESETVSILVELPEGENRAGMRRKLSSVEGVENVD